MKTYLSFNGIRHQVIDERIPCNEAIGMVYPIRELPENTITCKNCKKRMK